MLELRPGMLIETQENSSYAYYKKHRLVLSITGGTIETLILDTNHRSNGSLANLLKKTIGTVSEAGLTDTERTNYRFAQNLVRTEDSGPLPNHIVNRVHVPKTTTLGELPVGSVGVSLSDRTPYLVLLERFVLNLNTLALVYLDTVSTTVVLPVKLQISLTE